MRAILPLAFTLALLAPAASADAQTDAAALAGSWLLASAASDDGPRCNVQLNGGSGAGPYRVSMSLSCGKIAAFTGRVHGWLPRGQGGFTLTDGAGGAVIGFTRQDEITFGSDDRAYVMQRALPE